MMNFRWKQKQQIDRRHLNLNPLPVSAPSYTKGLISEGSAQTFVRCGGLTVLTFSTQRTVIFYLGSSSEKAKRAVADSFFTTSTTKLAEVTWGVNCRETERLSWQPRLLKRAIGERHQFSWRGSDSRAYSEHASPCWWRLWSLSGVRKTSSSCISASVATLGFNRALSFKQGCLQRKNKSHLFKMARRCIPLFLGWFLYGNVL